MDYEKLLIEKAKGLTEDQLRCANMPGRVIVEVREVDIPARKVTAVINTAKVDTYRSVVSPRGLDDSYFKDWRLIKRGHQWEIGLSDWLNSNKNKTEWVSRAGLSKTVIADETLVLVDDGVLKGASVGIRSIEQHAFDETARSLYEEDYSDVGYKATPEMDWYIRKWTLGEWSIVGSPSNDEAKIARAVSGMSQDTQDYVWGEWFRVSFPAMQLRLGELQAKIESREDFAELEKRFTEKFDTLSALIETKLTERQTATGDNPKPTELSEDRGQSVVLGMKEARRILDDQLRKSLNYQLGKLD